MRQSKRSWLLAVPVAIVILATLWGVRVQARTAASTTPSTLSFGSVSVRASSLPQAFTLMNIGSNTIHIVSIASSTGQFIVSGPSLPLALTPRQSTSFQVVFAPTSVGNISGSIYISLNRNSQGVSTVSVSGTGLASTQILQSITLAPSNSSVSQSQTQQLTATGIYSDGSAKDVTASSTWRSSNTTVATINTGLAMGISPGSSQITATLGSVTSSSGSLTVVNSTTLQSIAVTPSNSSVSQSQTQQFSATGIYSDGSTKNITTSVTWASSNTSVATIGVNTGLATGISAGTSQIIAALGSVTSNSASLTVASATVAPSITAQPVNQTVSAGQTATFMAAANGTAPLSYQWQKNGANISGATFSNYTTPVTTTADTGSTYRLVVSNAKGTATSNSATLTVSAAAVAPSITSQPSGQTVTSGQTATFTASANGTAPLNYQWQKNGSNISGATSSSYTTPATTTADSGSTFRVVVNNSAGTATSNSAALTVNGAAVAPSITSQPSNQTVTAGQTATYTVAASGTAPLAYQWQKDGSNIGGATSPSYTTPATTSGDSGSTYRAVVSNSAGTATSNLATLTVNAAAVAPTITTQPTNQTVTAGQTATFTIAASGTAPLAYQWQKDGTNISGGTMASYTTSATTTADSGSAYRALVSNSIGTATSNSATLTVNSGTLKSYKTNFPLAENPISESGHWINGGTDGLDWGNVQVGANHVYGTNLPSIYGDPTAVLTGSWSSDQQAQGTVSVNTSQPNCCHEVELRLRTTITAHSITGYEINCSVSSGSPYVQIVRWNGPLASFAYVNTTGSTGCVNGDIFKATIVGSTITVYKNGNQVLQGIDSTFTSGSPGVGFYDNQDSNWSDFGFSSFTATEISGAP